MLSGDRATAPATKDKTMKTTIALLALTLAFLALTSCTRLRNPDATPVQYARIMPNGTDIDAATKKCSSVTSSPDVQAACVRALRADVCGDGISHTADGTMVELVIGAHDTLGAEAMWTPGRASCVGLHTRPMIRRAAQACGVPIEASCGSGRALIATRIQ